MRQRTYLNTVLTVNALLLGTVLWTQVADTPFLATEAAAQRRTKFAHPAVIPNAAKQRDAQLSATRDLQAAVRALSSQLERGGIRVEVTNLNEIRMDGS